MTPEDFEPIEIDENRNFYTVEEVAPMFLVTPHTVRGWIRRKELVAGRVGRMYLIYPEDLRRFVAEKFEIQDRTKEGIAKLMAMIADPPKNARKNKSRSKRKRR